MAKSVDNKNGFVSKIFKWLLNIMVFLACFIVGILLFYVFLAQVHSNDEKYKPAFSFYTIVSPSMNPVIKVYDVVVNVRVNDPEKIEVGDIITYVSTNSVSEGMTITHRVVNVYKNENGNYEYQTQGDNNSEPDSVLVTFDNVIGKEVAIIPAFGKIQFLLADKKGWIFLLLIPIAFFILKDIYELIELLGLRRKVDKVTGYIEEPDKVVKAEAEKERKEILRRESIIKEVKEDALVRSSSESDGFLEGYSEKYLTLGRVEEPKNEVVKPKEIQTIKIIKPDVIVGEEVVANTNNKELNKQVKELEPVISNIEILDTDELTHKIKMYDEKLVKLNNMLKELENMKVNENNKIVEKVEEPKTSVPVIKDDDYLVGKQKVVDIQVAQKKRGRPKKQTIDEEVLLKTSLIPQVGNLTDSIDKKVQEIRKEIISKKEEEKPKYEIKNKKLNVKQKVEEKKEDIFEHINELLGVEEAPEEQTLSTDEEIIEELNNFYKKDDKELLFNPKIIKKVDKNENVVSNKKKKKRFIVLEKVDKKRKK